MEQIAVGGVTIEGANIIHDSTREVFRRPLGAVPCGTEIALALKISRIDIERATLCLLHSGAVYRFDMETEDVAGACGSNSSEGFGGYGGGIYSVRYTAPDAEAGGGFVLWYWFEIALKGGAICYYGAEPPYGSGLGHVYPNPPPAFQITAYDESFATPDWAKSAIMYQIFPDRFHMGDVDSVRTGVAYHRDKGRTDMELHGNWDDLPIFEAQEGQRYYMPCDIFGGDLEGIRQKLSYIKELGATLIYINPIFEAASNHRYNTGDYLKIDPILGDADSFRKLVGEARAMGVRIVLDGVFSHTGDDSLYFNKYGRYDSVGAYQSKDSPYFGWYKFGAHPDEYASWWGFESLPETDEYDAVWQEFVVEGHGSVVKHWIGEGAAGYRLDVADELPDDVIERIRMAVKEADPESFLIGEVWEDATTKQSYGKERTYALGLGLDSVMNYPFLNMTLEYLRGGIGARLYARFLTDQRHTYPAPMYYTLMNLISSHDVSRIRTMLAADIDPGGMPRAEQARFRLSEEEYELGGRRQRLAVAIQFSLPGIPSIYYGDEVGMTGLLDPFNRRAFCEEDKSIVEWYRGLGRLRSSYPVLATGDVSFFSTSENVLGILRYAANSTGCPPGHMVNDAGPDAILTKGQEGRPASFFGFGNDAGPDAMLTVVNPADEPYRIVIDLDTTQQALGDVKIAHSLLDGRAIPFEKGLIAIDMPPLSAEIFRLA